MPERSARRPKAAIRRPIKAVLGGLIVSSLMLPTAAFLTAPSSKRRIRRLHSTDEKKDELFIEEKSNFWVAVRRKDNNDDEWKLPYHSQLDNDGPLPSDCYRILGDEANDPKPTCLVAIDLTLQSTVDSDVMLSYVHECIDSGLTTFTGETSSLYKHICQETPLTVLNKCNLITTIETPKEMSFSPRGVLLGPLHEMEVASCYDTLQLKWNRDSPDYYMDLVHEASELQREGLIRSITGLNVPPHILRQVHCCGYSLESNQVSANLLQPLAEISTELLLAARDTQTLLTIDSPLAGGLLTNVHYDQPAEPYKFQLTSSERTHLSSMLNWARRNADARPWDCFQNNMMNVLHDIAFKHEVTIDTVALRWALQLDKKASNVIVEADLREEMHGQPGRLRKVFALDLDEDDMERLWKASGCEKPTLELLPDMDGLEENDNGLFLPSDMPQLSI